MISPKLRLMEVCPRDGWQNLKKYIPLKKKLEYIFQMLEAGVDYMQVTSFVSPKAVPQMVDAAELAWKILREYPDRDFGALVPNLRGAQMAAEAGFREVSSIVSVSESHNLANINRGRDETLEALARMRDKLPGLKVTPALCTVFGCPFEGYQPSEKTLGIVRRLMALGFESLELADTIGSGNPVQVAEVFSAVKREFPAITLMAHMHDTRNNGILNSWVAAQNGADVLHASLGGLGGCPFAPGASGNTASEDLVWLLKQSGVETGPDFQKLLKAAKKMRSEVAGNYSGHQSAMKKDVYGKACLTAADG